MASEKLKQKRIAALKPRLMDIARGAGVDADEVEREELDLVANLGSRGLEQFMTAVRQAFPFEQDEKMLMDWRNAFAHWHLNKFENFDKLAAHIVEYTHPPIGILERAEKE